MLIWLPGTATVSLVVLRCVYTWCCSLLFYTLMLVLEGGASRDPLMCMYINQPTMVTHDIIPWWWGHTQSLKHWTSVPQWHGWSLEKILSLLVNVKASSLIHKYTHLSLYLVTHFHEFFIYTWLTHSLPIVAAAAKVIMLSNFIFTQTDIMQMQHNLQAAFYKLWWIQIWIDFLYNDEHNCNFSN
jgi:hypothetical protein